MRPERLVMQAFGPYAGRAEVDFSALLDAGLFLVHGPTGAGKTSILDAICFALYGTASGRGRDGLLPRSHHAAPDMPTEVRLDFALGRERYRIIRRPEQPRPRKRGEGYTTARAEAALYRLPDGGTMTGAAAGRPGDEDEEQELVVSGPREVREEVSRLLGFDEHQFRQVVMLPQGEFRRFIEADTRTRQDILRRLFGTETCRQLEDALRQRAADLSGRLDVLRQQVDDILGRNRAADGTDLEKRKRTLKEAQGQSQSFRDALERMRASLADVLGKAQAHHEAAARMAGAEEAVKAAERALETAGKAHEAAESTLLELQEREAERQRKARRLEEIEAFRNRAAQLQALQAQEAALARDLATLATQRDKLLRRRKEHEEALAAARAAQEEALALQTRVADLKARHEGLQQACRHLNGLKEALAAHAEAEADLERADAHLAACRQARDTRRQALEELEARWRRASAALLARSLKPGEPCPVCGSHEHPAPARDHADLPDEAEEARLTAGLKAAEEALEAARRTREEAAARLAARTEALRQVAGRLAETLAETDMDAPAWLTAKGTDVATLSPALVRELEKTLRSCLDEARRAHDTAERERKEKAATAARIPDLERELKRLQERLEALQARRADLQSRQAKVAGQRETLRRDLPADLPDLGALDEEIRALKGWMGAHDEALEAARREKESCAQALARARGQLQSAQAAREETRARHEEARVALKAALLKALDTSLPADDPVCLPAPAHDTAWSRRRRQVHEALATALASLERNDLPDMAALKAAREALDAALADVHVRLGELGGKLTALEADLAAIEKAETERRTLEKRAGLLHHLATLAVGRQEPKVSFETFVLARLFEEVLGAASLRLLRMSRGRYSFERVDEEGGIPRDRRRRTGLDMVVRDAHTGTIRPVQSLSGGESFLAALALALGLADVARRHAGGRHLETLFIDEGFGSLDPEALDHAMAALADLQQDGRLIGIISHVAELKERIPVRLAIIPTPRGSLLQVES